MVKLKFSTFFKGLMSDEATKLSATRMIRYLSQLFYASPRGVQIVVSPTKCTFNFFKKRTAAERFHNKIKLLIKDSDAQTCYRTNDIIARITSLGYPSYNEKSALVQDLCEDLTDFIQDERDLPL